MLELFPAGFEERELGAGLELAVYGDAEDEARVRAAFGTVTAEAVEAGWEERWREFHRGVRAGPLWVGPPWEEPPDGLVDVVIDPGLAFGTGAHATTRLCLECIADLPRGSMLDAGCGSGVLAIAAAKLGYAPVLALDVDPAAVAVAVRNAEANGVDVGVRVADVLAGSLPEADVTVANLALEAVAAVDRAARTTWLVTSGYLSVDRLDRISLRHVRRRELEGWAADVWAPHAAG
jgi:ribosomal protein L11 methyltransferase